MLEAELQAWDRLGLVEWFTIAKPRLHQLQKCVAALLEGSKTSEASYQHMTSDENRLVGLSVNPKPTRAQLTTGGLIGSCDARSASVITGVTPKLNSRNLMRASGVGMIHRVSSEGCGKPITKAVRNFANDSCASLSYSCPKGRDGYPVRKAGDQIHRD